MPRYEFSEGSSNKFWEIKLDGKAFTTSYGKIGSAGQTTIKTWKDAAQAQVEYDKLVAEKTKKGYELVGGKAGAAKQATKGDPPPRDDDDDDDDKPAPKKSGGAGTRDARNPQLEKAIAANPTDRDAYAVFADWLQEQGDPRGELIALQLGYKDKQAKTLIDKDADYFLGPLVGEQKTRDGLANNSVSHLRTSAQEKEWQKTGEQAFLWRNGFIYRVRISHDSYNDSEWKGSCAKVLEQVLDHPSGRYVVELSFMSNGDPNEGNLQDIIDVLAHKAPATTRKITFGDNIDQISWHHTGDLDKLWKAVPGLKILEIESGEFDVGKMVAPNLERGIFITGGLSKACGKNLATAAMPKIKHLELYYGTDEYGGDCSIAEVIPLLGRGDLPKLEYLGLKNSTFANDIAAAVAGSKLVKQLKVLDLSLGTMTDEGAHALAAGKSSLAHLECLDLTRNYLTKDGIKAVKGICAKVVTEKQEEADDDDRYVSITE
ncbi:MAG TPA: WGR domain-containing protein [Kofleriaceae bacterium]|jgi:uncharacterized protein (TIGR02996 family)|nr:WGR domain-containing protein [Kofleriaceae bacterium]